MMGLSRFWKTSFSGDCRFIKISSYSLAVSEIRSRYLMVLGWKTPEAAHSDLVKLDLTEKLQFLATILEFFVGNLEDLPCTSVANKDDFLHTVFALYPLTWWDMRVKTDPSSSFKVKFSAWFEKVCVKCHI